MQPTTRAQALQVVQSRWATVQGLGARQHSAQESLACLALRCWEQGLWNATCMELSRWQDIHRCCAPRKKGLGSRMHTRVHAQACVPASADSLSETPKPTCKKGQQHGRRMMQPPHRAAAPVACQTNRPKAARPSRQLDRTACHVVHAARKWAGWRLGIRPNRSC